MIRRLALGHLIAIAVLIAGALTATVARADLTPAQRSTLKTAALADGTATALMSAGDDLGLAAWFNAPDLTYWVWRTTLQPEEYLGAITWTEVDALTAGKARIWDWMTGGGVRAIEPARANIRQGLADAFSAATTTRNALTALAKRNASRAERALATGTGTNAVPATLGWEGPMSPADASLVRVQ